MQAEADNWYVAIELMYSKLGCYNSEPTRGKIIMWVSALAENNSSWFTDWTTENRDENNCIPNTRNVCVARCPGEYSLVGLFIAGA